MIGGGEFLCVCVVMLDVVEEGGCEDVVVWDVMGLETAGDDARARAYRRSRGWRDILCVMWERVW